MANAIEGTWEMIRAELAGEGSPELLNRKIIIELQADSYAVRFDGAIVDRGAYEHEETAKAHTLLLTGMEGPNAGRKIPCIYQIVGDRLRICYGLDGTMPSEFTTAVGDRRYLATYRRRKPVQH